MRQLTEDEANLTKKGIKRIGLEVSELLASLDYNKAIIELQKQKREFDDKYKDYLRTQKDKQDKELIKQEEDIIKSKQQTIEQMQKHLDYGVEEKIPLGVA